MKASLFAFVFIGALSCGAAQAGGAMNGGGGTDECAAVYDPSFEGRKAKALIPHESLEQAGTIKPDTLDLETQCAIERGDWAR